MEYWLAKLEQKWSCCSIFWIISKLSSCLLWVILPLYKFHSIHETGVAATDEVIFVTKGTWLPWYIHVTGTCILVSPRWHGLIETCMIPIPVKRLQLCYHSKHWWDFVLTKSNPCMVEEYLSMSISLHQLFCQLYIYSCTVRPKRVPQKTHCISGAKRRVLVMVQSRWKWGTTILTALKTPHVSLFLHL